MSNVRLLHADLLKWLRGNEWLTLNGYLPRYHAVLSDPPYFLGSIAKRFGKANAAPAKFGTDGLFARQSKGFMGQQWDGFESVWHYQAWVATWARLLLSFVYPGALGFFFGGTRTYHRLAAGLEDAGWEVVDCMMYVYGSGFPKSHNVDSYGTALKPAYEPIVVCRAPRGKYTFAQLYQQFGTGLFNIDGARVQCDDKAKFPAGVVSSSEQIYGGGQGRYDNRARPEDSNPLGRWPANVILDDVASAALDTMSGDSISTGGRSNNGFRADNTIYGRGVDDLQITDPGYGDSGGASRFFYTAKAAAWEREAGLDGFERKLAGAMAGNSQPTPSRTAGDGVTPVQPVYRRNTHPTLKPIELTEYLARLLLPPAHIGERRLLVPFGGVGSECIGAHLAGWDTVDGIEREAEYVAQGRARLDWWTQRKSYAEAKSAYAGDTLDSALSEAGQLSLLDYIAQEAAHAGD